MSTPFVCSVHTHATFCDGKDTMEDMVAAAYTAGVRYYGISCHSHTPIAQDEGFVLSHDMADYQKTAAQLREQYLGKMEVLFGLEWDSCADVKFEGFDYWIGSVHYLHPQNGKYYAIDLDTEVFTACRDEAFGGNVLAMVKEYFEQVSQMAALHPTILGHMDLITKYNAGNRFFDEDSKEYKALALQALQAVDPEKTALEINTGAMARGYRKTPYPALFLLKEWKTLGGHIILTSDAHSADGILYGYDDAISFAKQAGFAKSVLLTKKGFVECPL